MSSDQILYLEQRCELEDLPDITAQISKIYEERGVSKTNIDRIIQIVKKESSPPKISTLQPPLQSALATYCSFVILGTIFLVSYFSSALL